MFKIKISLATQLCYHSPKDLNTVLEKSAQRFVFGFFQNDR